MLTNFGSKLKDFVFEADTTSQPSTAPANTKSVAPAVPLAFDADYAEAIRKTVFEKPTALSTLLAAADKLAGIIPDSATRLKSAHAMTGDGSSATQVIVAIDNHLLAVDTEEQQFTKLIKERSARETERLKGEAALAEQNCKLLKTKIDELSIELAALTKSQAQIDTVLQTYAEEFSTAQAQFAAAAKSIRAELLAHKQAIAAALS